MARSQTDDEALPETAAEADVDRGLVRAAAGGVLWQGLSYIFGKLLTLATTVILARVLTPTDFGLVGLAMVFITYLEVTSDMGLGQAVVFFPREKRRTDAAITVAFAWSLLLAGGAVLAAPLVADFFDQPRVAPMFRVVALALLVGGLGSVPDAILRRELRFRRRLITVLGRVIVKGVASVALAVAGFGAWALIWGYVLGEAAWMVASWALAGVRPGRGIWRLSSAEVKPLLGYGVPAATSAILSALVFNVDYLVVGERLGPKALGLYTMAYRIPELLILQALWVVSTVTFPMFSLVRQDMQRLRRGYLANIRLQTAYGAATGVGLAIVAPMLVPIAFGEKWSASIVPLQAIALGAVFNSLAQSAVSLYKGIGRPSVGVALWLVRLILVVPALLLATRFGIDGVSWAQAGSAFLMAVLYQAVAIRLIQLEAGRLLRALIPGTVVALGTLLGGGAVRLLLPGSDVVRLAMAVLAGGALGIACLWLVDRSFLREVWRLLRRRASESTAV